MLEFEPHNPESNLVYAFEFELADGVSITSATIEAAPADDITLTIGTIVAGKVPFRVSEALAGRYIVHCHVVYSSTPDEGDGFGILNVYEH